MFSFFGVVDVLSIMPTYLEIFFPGSHYLLTIRILRVLRIFRVLKLIQYIHEINFLKSSLYESRRKILVFMFTVLTVMIVLGSLMYLIEGEENGFSNIPISIYWAIVTMSTVGYGDIAPNTVFGKILASISILIGYAIIAVPTGIVTARMIQSTQESTGITCKNCNAKIIMHDAAYCHKCGSKLH
jgi:voltage-gated potassium channel